MSEAPPYQADDTPGAPPRAIVLAQAAAHDVVVESIRIRRAIAPLRRPLATRIGTFTHGPFLLIDLTLRGGVEGRLLAFTFKPLALDLLPPLLESFTAWAAQRPVSMATMETFYDDGLRHLSLLGHEGLVQMAQSMFDMVLHDALARELGLPLFRLLGGQERPIPAYNSNGLGLLAPDAAATEARELAGDHGGYRHIKMRLGRASIQADRHAIREVRAAVGPDIAVSADFNQGLDAAQALELCRQIDDEGLTWIEEPIVYDDYPTQARLAAKLKTPLQIGENFWSWRTGQAAIAQHACDFIMPDILRIGGITGWRRLARVAQAHAVPMSSHLSPEFSAHALAATPTVHWLEFMDWGQDLILEPIVPNAGFVSLNQRPGAGIDWNEKVVADYLIT
ncbi:MAG: enolase C-terminal domain-like protein [Pseudomonadota bacterium]